MNGSAATLVERVWWLRLHRSAARSHRRTLALSWCALVTTRRFEEASTATLSVAAGPDPSLIELHDRLSGSRPGEQTRRTRPRFASGPATSIRESGGAPGRGRVGK